MQNIIERISKIADNQGIKITNLEKEIGASKGVLSRALKNNTDIQSKWISSIVENYPNYNSEWLLTGKGEMIKENINYNIPDINNVITDYEESDITKMIAELKSHKKQLELKKAKGVPYYDVDFTASFLEVENNQQTQPDSYISHPFFKNCDLVVRASGQSMAKLIKHGDAIGLTRVENWFEFIPLGEIYAIVTKNNFRMIKIITKGDTEEKYTLISKPTDSKKDEFPAQQIKKNQILHVYKVQASATLF